jgi:colicin import membrane protein
LFYVFFAKLRQNLNPSFMEELVKKLVEQAGISEEQAKKAVEVFKAQAQEEGFMDKLGEWAGGAKEKLGDFAEGAKEKLGDLAEEASEAFEKAKGFVSGIWNKVTGGDEEKKEETPKQEEKK